MSSNNQNKLGNSKGKIQTRLKTVFYKWIQKKFCTISKAYQFNPKHHRNIIEIYFEHLGSSHPFWWNFFETRTSDFLKTLYCWSFWQKIVIFFGKFFLTPPIFWPKTDKMSKKSRRTLEISQIPTKKFFGPIWQKMSEKIQKRTPPLWKLSKGRGCFWNGLLMTFFTWHEIYPTEIIGDFLNLFHNFEGEFNIIFLLNICTQ